MIFNLPNLIFTASLLLGAGAASQESNTTTVIVPTGPTCEPSNGSPMLSDARKAADQLVDFSIDRCSGDFGIANNTQSNCVTLHCFGSACISRCASNEATRSHKIACTQIAEWIKVVIETPGCWTKDQKKVGGRIRLLEAPLFLQWTDVNVHINPRFNLLRRHTMVEPYSWV